MNACDTYENNTHVAPSPSFRFVALSGKSKVRQARASGIDLAKGRGDAVVEGTRKEARGRRKRVSGTEIGGMLELGVKRRFEVQFV